MHDRDEHGGAMIAVVLVSMVASLLAIAALASASGALRSSTGARSAERALNLAEAAASRALSVVAASPSYSNTGSMSATPSEADVMAAAATLAVESAPDGEMAWVVPHGDGVAYGVGYVPSRAQADVVRIAVVEYVVEESAAAYAVLTEGDLTLGGSASVSGLGGSIHSNGNLVIAGTSTVAGDASAAGTASTGGTGTVSGSTASDAGRETLPGVDPSEYRDLTNYDLCPDSTVRATSGVVCGGAILGTGAVLGWNGWTYSVLTGWTMSKTTTIDGGFYVHAANARVTGSAGTAADPWLATIVVGGTNIANLLTSGDLTIAGNAVVRPWGDGVLGVADRDTAISGSTYDLEGLVIAGEQVGLSGDGDLTGQVVSAGTANTTGSPVSANTIDDCDIDAEFGAPISVGGVSVTRWTEL